MATEIPRALHQIWIGPNPIPDQHRLWMEGWKRAHPAWSYRLWRDDEIIPRLPAAALEMFRAANSHAGKADVARVWLVHQLGGVYVDTDFECLRPIDDLLVGCSAFLARSRDDGRVTNAIFGARSGHPFLQAVIDVFAEHFRRDKANATGPLLFTSVLRSHGRESLRVLEREVFFPVPWNERARLRVETAEDWPGSHGAHHFAESWVPAPTARRILEALPLVGKLTRRSRRRASNEPAGHRASGDQSKE